MMEYKLVKETNHTYVVIDQDEERIKSDFRYRMLKENRIDGTIEMDIRNINGSYKIYYDITDMESLTMAASLHTVSFDDMEKLFKELVMITSELEKILCEEESLILNPDLIFKNRITDTFEFICLPVDVEEESGYQADFLQFFMNHIETSDEKAIEGLFEIYDMVMSGNKKFSTLYEKYASYNHKDEIVKESPVEYKTKEDDDYKKEERENIIKILSKKYYIPSLQESIAGALLLCGVISIGLYIYLGWI